MTVHLGSNRGLQALLDWSRTNAMLSRKDGFLTIQTPRPQSDGERFYNKNLWCALFQRIYEGSLPQRAASISFLAEVPRTPLALSALARSVGAFTVAHKISRVFLWKTDEVCFKDVDFFWGSLPALLGKNRVTFAVPPEAERKLAALGMRYETVVRGGTASCRLSIPTDAILELVLDEWNLNPLD